MAIHCLLCPAFSSNREPLPPVILGRTSSISPSAHPVTKANLSGAFSRFSQIGTMGGEFLPLCFLEVSL